MTVSKARSAAEDNNCFGGKEMDFKQQFSKQLTKVSMKTSGFLEENKINTYIATLEDDIRKLKLDAGDRLYSMWVQQTYNQDELQPMMESIREKLSQIEEQKQKLLELKQKDSQILGKDVKPADPAGNAGTAAADDTPLFCPGCGERTKPGAKFCRKCGTKLGA